MTKKVKAICDTCTFKLNEGDVGPGDTCPWCGRGILQEAKGNE